MHHMRYLTVFVVLAAVLLTGATLGIAWAQTSAQEKGASLRAQLTEVEAKQAELQTRLRDLEEGLKPENIEKALAGVGSTHPEDLREQRRRQIEIERNTVRSQLDLLNTSHSRLEKAIATADAEAYRQSAAPPKGPSVEASATTYEPGPIGTPQRRHRRAKKKRIKKKATQTNHSQPY